MHDTLVILKDGTKVCGPIWEFSPKKGYMTILGTKVFFCDVKSAITKGVRIYSGYTIDRDELTRARSEGWAIK